MCVKKNRYFSANPFEVVACHGSHLNRIIGPQIVVCCGTVAAAIVSKCYRKAHNTNMKRKTNPSVYIR